MRGRYTMLLVRQTFTRTRFPCLSPASVRERRLHCSSVSCARRAEAKVTMRSPKLGHLAPKVTPRIASGRTPTVRIAGCTVKTMSGLSLQHLVYSSSR